MSASGAEELVRSAGRFAWAVSLFGARRLAESFGGDGSAEGFDPVTRAAEGQLGESLGAAFRAGNEIQRGMVDIAFDILTLRALTPGGMLRSALELARCSAELARVVAPSREGRLAWQEFRNKLEVYELFDDAEGKLRVVEGSACGPTELVERAVALGPFRSVWVMEGAGHFYAEAAWQRERGAPVGLLTDAVTSRGRAALHAGMGLAFASRVLQNVGGAQERDALRRALRRFAALCRDNSHAAYVGAAYEALGLVARNLHPQLIEAIDELLAEDPVELNEYFWHGVGRAIYFAPTNLPPFGDTALRAIESARREPPHDAGRRNALAGVVWALTLVNLRQPEFVESLLARCGARLPDYDAFRNGVASALVVWRDSTREDDPCLAAWRGHRAGPRDSRAAELWNGLVSRPSEEALERIHPALERRGRLGEVFRYQSLERLAVEADDVRTHGGSAEGAA